MQSVDKIARSIVEREGGYVNDPSDRGGATKYGVTIGTMRRLGLDLDRDGDTDADDVRLLSIEQAVDIFKEHYYRRPKIDRLPEALRPSVFDMQVNAGGNAIKILQRVLVAFGEKVSVDGGIGPQTIAAASKVFARAGDYLVDAYGIARRNYYFDIADRSPSQRKYAVTRAGTKGGWILRAEEFISPRYDMSDADFKERISKWA